MAERAQTVTAEEIEPVVVYVRAGGSHSRGPQKADGMPGDVLLRFRIPASAEAWVRDEVRGFDGPIKIRVFLGEEPADGLPKGKLVDYWRDRELTWRGQEQPEEPAAQLQLAHNADPEAILAAQLVSLQAQVTSWRDLERVSRDGARRARDEFDAERERIANERERLSGQLAALEGQHTESIRARRESLSDERRRWSEDLRALDEAVTAQTRAGVEQIKLLAAVQEAVRTNIVPRSRLETLLSNPGGQQFLENVGVAICAGTLGAFYSADEAREIASDFSRHARAEAFLQGQRHALSVVKNLLGPEAADKVAEAL